MILFLSGFMVAATAAVFIRILQNGRALRRVMLAESSARLYRSEAFRALSELRELRVALVAESHRVERLRGERQDLMTALKREIHRVDELESALNKAYVELKAYALELQALRKKAAPVRRPVSHSRRP